MSVQVRALEVIEVTVSDATSKPKLKWIYPVQDTGAVLWVRVAAGDEGQLKAAYATSADRQAALEDLGREVGRRLQEGGAFIVERKG